MFHDPAFLLMGGTLLCVVAFGVWNIATTRRRHKYGPDVEGIGGRKDPLSGDS